MWNWSKLLQTCAKNLLLCLVIICSLKEKAEFIRHQHYCLVFASLNCWRLRLTIDAQFTTEGVLKWTPKKWPHKDQVVAPIHTVSFCRIISIQIWYRNASARKTFKSLLLLLGINEMHCKYFDCRKCRCLSVFKIQIESCVEFPVICLGSYCFV